MSDFREDVTAAFKDRWEDLKYWVSDDLRPFLSEKVYDVRYALSEFWDDSAKPAIENLGERIKRYVQLSSDYEYDESPGTCSVYFHLFMGIILSAGILYWVLGKPQYDYWDGALILVGVLLCVAVFPAIYKSTSLSESRNISTYIVIICIGMVVGLLGFVIYLFLAPIVLPLIEAFILTL